MQIEDDRIRRRIVALTRDLILIPSIPSRPEDRRRCYEFVKNHLEAENGVEIYEYEDRGIPSLVATARGCREPDILMCAHLDVITHPDIGFYRSEIRDGRIIGPGAGDSSRCLVSCLNDDDSQVRLNAVRSLGMITTIGDTDVLPALEEVTKDKNQAEEVRKKAHKAISRIMKSGDKTN